MPLPPGDVHVGIVTDSTERGWEGLEGSEPYQGPEPLRNDTCSYFVFLPTQARELQTFWLHVGDYSKARVRE